jgi:hypothetical protein
MTFHRDGTMTAAANAPGGSPFDTPEYGSWQREPGSQNYSFRAVSYGYDENGAFTGRGEITATITLAADGNSFTWDSTIDVYDADGNLLFSFCGMWTGTRFE